MLVDFLGNDAFATGVRRYLQRHKYGNASTGDLWRALSEASGIDVAEMMTSWTKQVGYPAVTLDGTSTVRQVRQRAPPPPPRGRAGRARACEGGGGGQRARF